MYKIVRQVLDNQRKFRSSLTEVFKDTFSEVTVLVDASELSIVNTKRRLGLVVSQKAKERISFERDFNFNIRFYEIYHRMFREKVFIMLQK